MNYDALIKALEPLTQRVRTDVTAVKGPNGQAWTGEALNRGRLRQHLNGGPARGVCPIKAGENTTMVGLLDFDSHKGETSWPEMQAAALKAMDALRAEGLTPIPWRSSGGQGIHVFTVWDTPQDAYTVRQVLAEALAASGFKDGAKGVKAGQVEVFPKQDSVPADGYGNQFVLPLAGKSEPLDALELEPMGRDPGCVVWPMSAPLVKREKPVRERAEVDLDALVDLAELRSALGAIPNDAGDSLSYDDWRNVVFAINHATDGSDEGRELAHEFSARSPKYDPEFLDNRVWPYVRDREASITARTVFSMAREHGWGGTPTAPDEFDVVDTAKVEAEAQAADAAKPLKFAPESAASFASVEGLPYLVDDVLPKGGLAVIYGASGSGKTFAVLDIVMSVARGVEWRGLFVEQAAVVYVVAEGSGGFRKRLSAYAQHHDVDLNGVPLHIINAAPNMLEPGDTKELIRSVQSVGPVGIVVVDTLAQVTPGGNENASEDMGKALAHCKRIHQHTGALVLLVHHSGKDQAKGARGHTSLRAACDAEIEVTREGKTARKLAITKSKDGIDDLEWGFELEQVHLGVNPRGKAITSCVVRVAEVPKAVKTTRKLGPNETVVNEVIQELATLKSGALSVDEVLAEAVSRVPEPEGKRDTRAMNLRRAIKSLCESVENYEYDEETGTVSVN